MKDKSPIIGHRGYKEKNCPQGPWHKPGTERQNAFTESVTSVRESFGYSLAYATGSVRHGLRVFCVKFSRQSPC